MNTPAKPPNLRLALFLLFAIFLWGGNNTGTKYILRDWPPIFTGATRFLLAGLILLVIARRGQPSTQPFEHSLRRRLWLQGGLSLAVYILAFNYAARLTPVSHVALYLGASPVWALLWEGRPAKTLESLKSYLAAALALSGVIVLFLPALGKGGGNWLGELLGLAASVLWTNYGRQCRTLTATLSGMEVSAHTMWRAGLLLALPAIIEVFQHPLVWRTDLVLIQLYCIIAGGVVAFGIWNNTLRYWQTSRVLLFNNLIPLSTMSWAAAWLHEPLTATFWLAMLLVFSGVLLRQSNWPRRAA